LSALSASAEARHGGRHNDSIGFVVGGKTKFGQIGMTIAAVTVMTAWQIKGQSPEGATTPAAPLAFEVASVKPIPPPIPSGGGPWIVTHGRFKAETGYVRGMIGWAYNVLAAQVKGGPDWVDR
jgi:hypothetical protein